MQLIANENFPLNSVKILRNLGHDIAAISEDSPGITDVAVLEKAIRERRIILTFDRDYGELIFKKGLPSPPGIIFFRFIPKSPEEPAECLNLLLQISELTLEGKFSVVDQDKVRQRSLPSSVKK